MTLNAPPHILRTVAECLGTFCAVNTDENNSKTVGKIKKKQKNTTYIIRNTIPRRVQKYSRKTSLNQTFFEDK